MAVSSNRAAWPESVKNQHQPQVKERVMPNQAAVTFVNHSTFLIQLPGLNVLTDPVWSKRVSPFTWIGPKRVREPGLKFEELPEIDLVLVSHNHYDHMDLATLKKLSDKFKPVVVVPIGDKDFLEKAGISNVKEMDWWERLEVEGANLTFAPAQHFSSRGLFDRNESLWGSFWLEHKGKNLFYAGDTGYSPHFKDIFAKQGAPDLAFLPIGAYEPNWFMKPVHMNPQEAVQAHKDLKSKQSVGIHFGTFQLTTEAIEQPLIALKQSLKDQRIAESEFVTQEEGQTVVYSLP